MTGAQEQKMKCICWELATDDLEYRYKTYYQKWNLGECSQLKDKTAIYKDLYSAIKAQELNYEPFNDEEKKGLIDKILKNMTDVFDNTNMSSLEKEKYEAFKDFFSNLKPTNITCDNKNIFAGGEVTKIYDHLYRYRNRCAHNTLSYQLNNPDLSKLRDSDFQKYDNIFLFYAVLLMIDEIFVRLFAKYEELRDTIML